MVSGSRDIPLGWGSQPRARRELVSDEQNGKKGPMFVAFHAKRKPIARLAANMLPISGLDVGCPRVDELRRVGRHHPDLVLGHQLLDGLAG